MKKNKTLCFLLFFLFLNIYCIYPINSRELPISLDSNYKEKILPINKIEVKTFNKITFNEQFIFLDSLKNLGNNTENVYGVSKSINLNFNENATLEHINGDTLLYRLVINMPQASSINFRIKNINLSENSELFIFDENFNHHYNLNSKKLTNNYFNTHLFYGETVIIELITSNKDDNFKIENVVYGFEEIYRNEEFKKEVLPKNTLGFLESLPCNIDANCPDGDNLCRQKRSTCFLIMPFINLENEPIFYLNCTGSLINNSSFDGRLLLITAFHCLDGLNLEKQIDGEISQDEKDLTSYFSFRFNYIKKFCNNNTLNGSFDLSSSNYLTGYFESDILLLEITDTVNIGANVFFNGWDRRNKSVLNSSSLHHPNGDAMKVSIDNDESFFTSTVPNSHDEFCFRLIDNDHYFYISWDKGLTQRGSSGAPLFDENNRTVGVLWGGCSPRCDNTNNENTINEDKNKDFYGRIYNAWSHLQPFLDPLNTGVEYINGFYNDESRYRLRFYGLTHYYDSPNNILEKNSYIDPINYIPGTSGQRDLLYGHHNIIEIGSGVFPIPNSSNQEIRKFLIKDYLFTDQSIEYRGHENVTVKAGYEIRIKPCTEIIDGAQARFYIDNSLCDDNIGETFSVLDNLVQQYSYIYNDNCEGIIGGIVNNNNKFNKVSSLQTLSTNFTLSPNPADESIRVSYQISGSGRLYLRNSLGVDLLPFISLENSTGTENIDISKFSIGIYFITIESDSGINTEKFVVSR